MSISNLPSLQNVTKEQTPFQIHHQTPSPLNYWYSSKSAISTTFTYNQPHHIIIQKEPKDNPFDLNPVSPIPSISSASIESRPLSPLSTFEDQQDDIWRNEFLNLISSLTRYAENLESMSVEILNIEGRVRELVTLEKAITEQYEQKEKLYLKRLEECEQVSERQSSLIQHLDDLGRDVEPTIASTSLEQSQSSNDQLMQINSMEDKLHLLRCEIGLFIGGSVGTGHVVHSFEGPVDGLEYIIAGSGTIAKSLHQSKSIQHIGFRKHEYMLHINQRDRESKFKLLPQKHWTPDNFTNQCQFQSCSTHFTFFNRRHHCRRCGILVCQRHSLNRLPLFSSKTKDRINNWYRICDSCFHDLIITKTTQHDSATHLSDL